MSLRLKLLLAASVLLVVPLAGYRFVLAMEDFLRANQVQAAAATARVLAAALESTPSVLPEASMSRSHGPYLHVHPLSAAPEVDGYEGDWAALGVPLPGGAAPLRAASHGGALYLLARIPVASGSSSLPLVRLLLEDSASLVRAWLLAPRAPGAFTPAEVPPAPGSVFPAHPDARIGAAVQRSRNTSVYEIRMPLALGSPRLRFEIMAGTRRSDLPRSGSFLLSRPPAGLSPLLDKLAADTRGRTRVTDLTGRVLAQAGTLEPHPQAGGLTNILDNLLSSDEGALLPLIPTTLTLTGPELSSALAGKPEARLRRAEADAPLVVSAAHPLRDGARVVGALVLEESTSSIQALGRRALLELLATAALAFVAGSAVVLTVAGRAAARLRTLRDQAARSVDESGRVHHAFQASAAQDEIGDLGRSFQATVDRLQGYQHYLEQLARRLSHELRTPLAVIRSSLDNMAMGPHGKELDAEQAPSLSRARAGVERLDALIRRMSEAARLEQAMSDTETRPLDLHALIEDAVAAQTQAHALNEVTLHAPSEPVWVRGSPELLLQALDKLLDNARDFAPESSAIRVCIHRDRGHVSLTVENDGPPLPAEQPQRLFDSMFSQRQQAKARDDPHLGLGLYIVRLVAEFHGGRPIAANLAGGNGVSIGMELPLAERRSRAP